ncbi:hypothetical protein ABZ137_38725 [Streptomyces bobili]|uniref:hypothetical protein n=1 Tax=Streptomyces bobili TaxID=67280 RepID=UPI0033A601EA
MTSTKPAGPDPAPRPKRRTFSPEYKLRIGRVRRRTQEREGAILRRERLYRVRRPVHRDGLPT